MRGHTHSTFMTKIDSPFGQKILVIVKVQQVKMLIEILSSTWQNYFHTFVTKQQMTVIIIIVQNQKRL